jgi:UDP-N-acetylglucosamine--N-acetylmuramyl-(pentapeptide) pyrophosphoryl-undecaprenol N-acetylglucosamine transferase
MKKNFLITTGGSGGHVIPALILYEHLSKEENVIITTDKRGLKYLDDDFYKCKIINTPRLNNIFLLPYNMIKIIILTLKSIFLLKNKKIEKILSTGGYMSLPLILAGKILKLEIFLLEPNQVLGRANKYFLSSCKKIFCYNKKIINFPENFLNKMVIIKPLVRENIYKLKSSGSIKDKFTILIVGGSQSASIFNMNLKNSIVNISNKKPIKIIQQTNKENVSYLKDFYSKNNIENKIFNFENNFENIIKDADLCITRSGASTLAELSVINIPFIAVPLPTSKDNHQLENANFYKENDCCWIIEQTNFEKKIEHLLSEILTDKIDYLKKKENLKKLNYQNTWINVNQKILEIINEN